MAEKLTGRLTLHVLRGNDLENKDIGGKQDPYCTLAIGSEKHKTKTHNKGGTKPVWNQSFIFNLRATSQDEQLHLHCFDEDLLSDDSIGRADPKLSAVLALRGKEEAVIQLVDKDNFKKITGYIYVKVEYTGTGAPAIADAKAAAKEEAAAAKPAVAAVAAPVAAAPAPVAVHQAAPAYQQQQTSYQQPAYQQQPTYQQQSTVYGQQAAYQQPTYQQQSYQPAATAFAPAQTVVPSFQPQQMVYQQPQQVVYQQPQMVYQQPQQVYYQAPQQQVVYQQPQVLLQPTVTVAQPTAVYQQPAFGVQPTFVQQPTYYGQR